MSAAHDLASLRLLREIRENFVSHLCSNLQAIAQKLDHVLLDLNQNAVGMREIMRRQDAMLLWRQCRDHWVTATESAWRRSLLLLSSDPASSDVPSTSSSKDTTLIAWTLVEEDVIENKLSASRISQVLNDRLSTELEDLRPRLQQLCNHQELSANDILRPEVVILLLVEAWHQSKLDRATLELLRENLQHELFRVLKQGYEVANNYLKKQGIERTQDLRSRVRRTASHIPHHVGTQGSAHTHSAPLGETYASTAGAMPLSGNIMPPHAQQHSMQTSLALQVSQQLQRVLASQSIVLPTQHLSAASLGAAGVMGAVQTMPGTDQAPVLAPSNSSGGVIHSAPTPPITISPELAQAILNLPSPAALTFGQIDPQVLNQALNQLRQSGIELKKRTESAGEKATIELVTMMFQSILSEERIPPSIRVWFSRLQIPVIRLALAEPEFFENSGHPARVLLDRMGSCVLGFDNAAIVGSDLEKEIRRAVQVIEQYPETGQRVFQLVLDEFQQFLCKFLPAKSNAQRVVDVAQQIEQKEALAVQYTIEIRDLLKDVPVDAKVREFLYKVWAEVLAIATMREGAQHASTQAFKQVGVALLRITRPQPKRDQRKRIIEQLPQLLEHMRQGMGLIGLDHAQQDQHIQTISDVVADAFLSQSKDHISPAMLKMLTDRLEHLEDYVTEAALDDLPLDADALQEILEIDSQTPLHVVADIPNSPPPGAGGLVLVQSLTLGEWYMLDHHTNTGLVQYSWCSQRGQLHLFTSQDNQQYLLQVKRLANYLQAGLLKGMDHEPLTLRATREVIAKLNANPERLLH